MRGTVTDFGAGMIRARREAPAYEADQPVAVYPTHGVRKKNLLGTTSCIAISGNRAPHRDPIRTETNKPPARLP